MPIRLAHQPALSGRRTLVALAFAAASACLTGCLTADGVLAPDGTGTLTLGWKVAPGTTESSQRAMVTAPGVKVESLKVGADGGVSAKLAVSELAGIGKTPLLKHVEVTRTVDGKTGTLTIAIKPLPKGAGATPEMKGPKIRITFPGNVLEANEKAKVDGTSAEWDFSADDWSPETSRTLTARWENPEAAAAPGGATGAPTPDEPTSDTKGE